MSAGPSRGPSIALADRLSTVHDVLESRGTRLVDAGVSLLDGLVTLIDEVRDRDDHAAAWLLVVGLTGAFPEPSLVRSVRRAVQLNDSERAASWLLSTTTRLAVAHGSSEARLRVVDDRPVVDVDHTARSDFLTGIQRVVRAVVTQWDTTHDVELVAWTRRGGAYRGLTQGEQRRLLTPEAGEFVTSDAPVADHADEVVVPWGVPVILTEVPAVDLNDRLSALAQFTGSSLRLIGYDCIPVASSETVPLAEPEKFGRYLELVKHADRVAGISQTAASEFEGFCRSLGAQGLRGPEVVACSLPTTTTVLGAASGRAEDLRPMVLCVGTVGRRKNQVALVEAAENLWREGLDFELRVLGHVGAERSPLSGLVPELQDLGRPLVLEAGVSDARIASSLAEARCLVFPSLHEGFGLPIVEALSAGVPVITSDFGSLREVAEGQGGLLVDPEDVDALTAAMRSLLTDDDLHARLVAQAASRPVRTWSHYAAELGECLL